VREAKEAKATWREAKATWREAKEMWREAKAMWREAKEVWREAKLERGNLSAETHRSGIMVSLIFFVKLRGYQNSISVLLTSGTSISQFIGVGSILLRQAIDLVNSVGSTPAKCGADLQT